MAASVLKRCLASLQTVSRSSSLAVVGGVSGQKRLLSSADPHATVWQQRASEQHNIAQLAALMDRTYERKLPVSSLTIARFVDSISSREEVDQAEYYLYKFRHSPNCWYLRSWTIHSWFRKCLQHGARDKALYTLKNKVQFGLFPDEFTFNLLMDSCLAEQDIKGACAVVEELMLQESFDHVSTQIRSLLVLSKRLSDPAELSWLEERSVGTALLLAGLKQDNTAGFSARLLGLALIGKVELSRGIHDVFHQMPLMWTPGYLGRALAVMEGVCADITDLKLSQEVLDRVETLLTGLSDQNQASEAALEEQDEAERAKLPHYISRFQELKRHLVAQHRLDPRSLESLVCDLSRETLAACEEDDARRYQAAVREWEAERHQLIERERELREKQHSAAAQ